MEEKSNSTNGITLYNILDGASSKDNVMAPEAERQKQIAANPLLPTEERVEAFEDIMESEVGDTRMSRARNIEREIGLRQIYLKFEGANPTGTQKDRIAFAQAMDAVRRGFDAITVATCGNYGVAIALAASFAGLKCIIYIPKTYQTRRIKEIEQYNPEIVRIEGDYEHAVEVSREHAMKEEIYDANPGGANTILQLRAYGEIAYEIYDELRDAPSAVAIPVSNGTTLAGIYKGFQSLYRRGKTSKIPKIVAGSSFRKNPIIQALLKNTESCNNLNPHKIKETAINEPLINWHSIDGEHALEAVRNSNGWGTFASDKILIAYSRLIREREGLNVMPASTAGLCALIDQHKKQNLPNDRYVVIITGRKS
ncbi:MAG: pyridoxal-phosphate dependent enzyme [bacterium]